MGTSGPYTPSPNWTAIKTDVTQALNSGAIDGEKAHQIVSDFIYKLLDQGEEGFGDVSDDVGALSPDTTLNNLKDMLKELPVLPSKKKWSSTRGSVGSGGRSDGGDDKGGGRNSRAKTGGGRRSTGGGSAVRPAAGRLASFLSDIPKVGLRQALLNAGVESVDDLPPDKIALAVADVLATDASLLIQNELREALSKVMEEICNQPDSFEEAEQMLLGSAYDLQAVVQLLFECYIMERFKTFFCEHEAKKHGNSASDKILKEARKFVAVEMELEKTGRRDLTEVDWGSAEGAKIIDGILERTIAVYTD